MKRITRTYNKCKLPWYSIFLTMEDRKELQERVDRINKVRRKERMKRPDWVVHGQGART